MPRDVARERRMPPENTEPSSAGRSFVPGRERASRKGTRDVNRTAGIVLCGGKSSRMGLPKAWLPFGPERMLPRVLRLLHQVAQPLVVVAAAGQELPESPVDAILARDERPDRGPVEGICAGLRALGSQAAAAYITSCDVPLLVPALVERLVELLADYQVVVPVEDGFHHPLAAVYRSDVLPELERLRAADRMRPVFLFDHVRTRRVPVEELRDVDPRLQTLTNLNTPREYLAALREAGFEAPDDVLAQLRASGDSGDGK